MRLVLIDVVCVCGGWWLFLGVLFVLGVGDVVFVMGLNGVGKFSLMWIVVGLLVFFVGCVMVEGWVVLFVEVVVLDVDWMVVWVLGFWVVIDGVGVDVVEVVLDDVGLGVLVGVLVWMLLIG